MYAFNPATGELIKTGNPAAWMGTTDVAPPEYDPAAASAFWTGESWEVHEAQDEPEPVPESITQRQCRMWLAKNKMLSNVDYLIDQLPEDEAAIARIDWQYATKFERNHPRVIALAQSMGADEAQIDAWFTEASKL